VIIIKDQNISLITWGWTT